MDPLTVLSLIATGLGVVDKFYDLTKKLQGEKPQQHRVNVKPREKKLVVEEDGYEQEVRAEELQLGHFDKVRHDTLWRRIDANWAMYNGLDEQRVTAAADEKVRLKLRMDAVRAELCPDFRKVVQMYERVLGRSLPDHYSLYGVCND